MNKRRVVLFGILFVAIAVFGYIWGRGWYAGYSEYSKYKDAEKDYIASMTEDTYGGKTPKETLDLFVSALRAQDVELASKYFMLDDNMSRARWVSYLSDIKAKGLMDEMAEDISSAREYIEGKTSDEDFKFAAYTDNGVVGVIIDMWFNVYSKVWKIENI